MRDEKEKMKYAEWRGKNKERKTSMRRKTKAHQISSRLIFELKEEWLVMVMVMIMMIMIWDETKHEIQNINMLSVYCATLAKYNERSLA